MKPGIGLSSLAVFFLCAFTSESVFGHARLRSGVVAPRNTNPGLKTPPCGGVARTANPAILTAGQTITVTWEETIQHPGRYEFYFSPAGDANFVLLKSVPDVQDGVGDLPHQYSTQITLPNTPCTACTLQMIQVMTENPAAPSNYYSCSDIQLISGPQPTPTPPGPIPSPTPNSADCP